MSRDSVAVKSARIRGTHPYSYRRGEWATIVGVVMATPKGFEPRPCFVAMYPDGEVDYKVIYHGDCEIETDGPREP